MVSSHLLLLRCHVASCGRLGSVILLSICGSSKALFISYCDLMLIRCHGVILVPLLFCLSAEVKKLYLKAIVIYCFYDVMRSAWFREFSFYLRKSTMIQMVESRLQLSSPRLLEIKKIKNNLLPIKKKCHLHLQHPELACQGLYRYLDGLSTR